MDAPQERHAPVIIRRPVERVKGRFEQGFSNHRPVCRFPFVPVEQLDCELADQRRPGIDTGGFLGVLAAVERPFLIVQLYHIFRRACPSALALGARAPEAA